MDPVTLVSTLVFGAAVATGRPKWEQDIQACQYRSVSYIDRSKSTELQIWACVVPETQQLVAPQSTAPIRDARDFLHAEIKNYANLDDGWNGDGSQKPTSCSVEAANAFLDAIPAGVPLPKTMISSSGHIEFFWDLPSGYADISFDAEGTGSFFARDQQRQELFLDELDTEMFTRAWFDQAMKHIIAPAKSNT